MNTKTILFIFIGLVVLAGGGVGVFLFLKNKKDDSSTVPVASAPTKTFINLPINDETLKAGMNNLLTEQELKVLQGWMLLIIKERKAAKKANTDKWKSADTELGLLKASLYQMDQKGKLKSVKLSDIYQQLAMLQYV